MSFLTRWDYIRDRAMAAKRHESLDELMENWITFQSAAERSSRVLLGAEETKRIAEKNWWTSLFPKEKFPVSLSEWNGKVKVLSGPAFTTIQSSDSLTPKPIKDTAMSGLAPIPMSLFPAKVQPIQQASKSDYVLVPKSSPKLKTYKSCMHIIIDKVQANNVSARTTLKKLVNSIEQAENGHLAEDGQAYTQFRSELFLWRTTFPNERFPGIDPATGKPNPRTYDQVQVINRQSRKEQRRDDRDLIDKLNDVYIERMKDDIDASGTDGMQLVSPGAEERGYAGRGRLNALTWPQHSGRARSASPVREPAGGRASYRERGEVVRAAGLSARAPRMVYEQNLAGRDSSAMDFAMAKDGVEIKKEPFDGRSIKKEPFDGRRIKREPGMDESG